MLQNTRKIKSQMHYVWLTLGEDSATTSVSDFLCFDIGIARPVFVVVHHVFIDSHVKVNDYVVCSMISTHKSMISICFQ